MKIKIGVMGSSEKPKDKLLIEKAREVGREIARHDCILVNGATTGMPNEAAIGANQEKGFVLGISPAKDLQDHMNNWKLPYKHYDAIIFTGIGFNFRNIFNIRTSEALVFIRGSLGTLNEFTIAYEDNKIIGVLDNTGGVSAFFEDIVKICNKKTDAVIIHDSDPKRLIERLIKLVKKKNEGKLRDRVTE